MNFLYMILVNPFIEIAEAVSQLIIGAIVFCVTTPVVFVVLFVPLVVPAYLTGLHVYISFVIGLAAYLIGVLAFIAGARAAHWAASGGISYQRLRGRELTKKRKVRW